ncbi:MULTISPECIES: 4-oxalocrotonate tautomerase [Pseudomonas]|uniref:4-oxalocrotonate tautomerase n=1 Tax=Pseudomonas lactis TaxID=1615674 RepID=A0ABS9FWW3_9PSED|nr:MULTISPECIES: 4-oxalocrotonate tautomerase [Pseudomonas]MCF4976285.1 4-oxalocrotonate tautomerase [Pseudomonas lactis]MCF5004693.1 4-oxalocrotonate tautomerase [Pseudomonas lactis]MCF5010382.1 4-oxalocrotonate tautomerase [Pseudomonas lactis]MCF5016252.1 4-oxalocrotonate tautomerase [Pseudomonas lactis]MCF5021421.1 4-oxalocrotonate tautomerase [Pseudomonas lactis]
MPAISLTISGHSNPKLVRSIIPKLTAMTCGVLDKRPEQTLVMVQFLPHELWFISKRSLSDYGRNSFRLEFTITDETNTKTQKARYQQEAFELLASEIGNVHLHSNVHVNNCRASAYGYGGMIQEYKFHQP